MMFQEDEARLVMTDQGRSTAIRKGTTTDRAAEEKKTYPVLLGGL